MKKTFRKLISVMIAVICISLSPISAFAVHEKESNDDFELATVINVNETNTGVTDDDKDFYKFTLDTDGYIEIEAYHDYGSIDQFIHLYNSNGKNINDVSFDVNSEKAPLMKIGLSKGTYYVQFFCDSFQRPEYNYSFTIKFTPSECWEKEYNGNVTKAALINIGTKYYGTYTSAGLDDYDYYKFVVKEDSWVSFTFRRDRGIVDDFISIRTYDLTKEKIVKSFNAESTFEKLTEKFYLTKGEYYFRTYSQVLDDIAPEYNFILNYEKVENTTTKAANTPVTQNHESDNKIDDYVRDDAAGNLNTNNDLSQNNEGNSNPGTENNDWYKDSVDRTGHCVDDNTQGRDYPTEPVPTTEKSEHNYKLLFVITVVVSVLVISVLMLYFVYYKPRKH